MNSPCIKICQMDPARGVCIGCCRTLDEIARWGGMSDEERHRVLAELPRRRDVRAVATAGPPPADPA